MIILPIQFDQESDKQSASAAGKLAARQAIQDFFFKRSIKLDLNEIEITKLPSGRPSFQVINHFEVDSSKFCLSVSHNDRFAAADISEIETQGLLGIDIETVRHWDRALSQEFLNESEQKLIAALPANEQDSKTTLFWSIKEAYLKALGVGLRTKPSTISVEAIDKESNLWYNIHIEANYVLTIVMLKPQS